MLSYSPATSTTEVERVATHYGVTEGQALQMLREGYPMPPPDAGLQGVLSGIMDNPIALIIIAGLLFWLLTKK